MISALIVAAGQGTRMGPNMDKLFISLAGKPVVVHTWQTFDAAPEIDEIVVVIRSGLQSAFEELSNSYRFKKPFRFVVGGKERQDSAWNGLKAVNPKCELVAIQDGARPCTSSEVITATLQAARETGAAVAAQRVTDTIKESADGKTVASHLDRTRLWSVQTPQCFRLEVIRRALEMVREKGLSVTDDTAACELIGQPVRLLESARPNPKITLPEDVVYVELLLRELKP